MTPVEATEAALLTAEELERRGDPGHRCELVRGRVVHLNPPGGRHGGVVIELACLLQGHIRRHDLGWLTTETGFVLARDPDLVRGPDLAFVSKARVPATIPDGFVPFAPDLVIEVVSPSDAYSDVLAEVDEYLAAGTREVWLVDPRRRRAEVRRAGAPARTLGPSDTLGSDLLPGLAVRLDAIL